jgi:CRISPR system Cascade subunit CasE
MYLSRLILNPRSRQVQRELEDRYQLHRTVMSGFAAALPSDERVLFRLEEQGRNPWYTLLVQSTHAPDWGDLSARGKDYLLPEEFLPPGWQNPAVKPLQLDFPVGKTLAFRLLANPTVKRNGKRYGLNKDDEQIAWFERKLTSAGCRVLSVQITPQGQFKGSKAQEGKQKNLEFLAVRFDGVLQIEDPDVFIENLRQGIGSGKGLGFGLLSLGPA